MQDTIRVLRSEHADLEKLLKILERQVVRSRVGYTPDYGLIEEILAYYLGYPDLCHHPKEDIVYDMVRKRDAGTTEVVQDIQAEHGLLRALTHRFRDAVDRSMQDSNGSSDWFKAIAEEFLDAYRRHIRAEETRLFPLAMEVLVQSDWAEVDARLADRKNPLVEKEIEARFTSLRDNIFRLDGGAAIL